MTDEQKNILKEYREKSYKLNVSVHINSTLHNEDKSDLLTLDKWAANDIANLQNLIEVMQLYRMEIAEKYASLETQSYYRVIKLWREKSDNKVWYHLAQWEEGYNDDYIPPRYQWEQPTKPRYNARYKTFEGKDRKKAIDKYNQIVKEHPEYKHILDIEKAKWEK